MAVKRETIDFLLTEEGRLKVREATDKAHGEPLVFVEDAPFKMVTVEDFLATIERLQAGG